MMPEHKPVVGVFADRESAESALGELMHAGFSRESIAMAAAGQPLRSATTPETEHEGAATDGAVGGAVGGGVAGAVAGTIAAIAFPPLAVALPGAFAVAAMGAAAGATLGTFAGPFLAMGMTEEDAGHLAKEAKAGRCVLAVQAGSRQDEAAEILRKHAPIDVRASNQVV